MNYSVGLDTSALDPTFKSHAGRGIGRYVSELTKYISLWLKDGSLDDFPIGFFDHTAFTLPNYVENIVSSIPAGRQTIRQQLLYPLQLQRLSKFKLLHFPAHMDAPSWSKRPFVTTVLDLIPLICRDLYEDEIGGWRFKLARHLELKAIKNASLIFAISECTATDVNLILNIPRDKIVVTHLGVDEKFYSRATPEEIDRFKDKHQLLSDKQYILYLGGIDPRKNWIGLLDIIKGLKLSFGDKAPVLLMSGRIEDDKQYPKLIEKIKIDGIQDQVRILGFTAEEELPSLFGAASLFIFPTWYEGFGLPPLEAMAAGVPVLSSNLSCLPEVLSDAAEYFSPYNIDDAVEKAKNILCSLDKRKSMIENGVKKAREYTWEKTALKTIEGYRRVLK